ncbi:class I adenylate-forming enzyme family protein [Bradyrhizobium sp. Arg237L]|uniref:class I adenylate-forming enzyme family protein n=1 Tax=Bradyrhizobium sp. Arg237L TaxID=3003352 RepID=UPI00249DE2C0|nr:class I adenylate-forming enzyme family protein [Bradyrhizobium sp. Arg237L]MDI4231753.1 class I adenylate-forming enzyme family protein [Bradyrhizobium sp. Arg237L]
MKLPAYLAAQAQLLPNKAALVCGENRVTFRQLHEDSSRIATYLRNSGINVGDRIAICLPNCCEFVTIFFAIVQCGAIAMPINMRLSSSEISAIIKDAQPAALFFSDSEREAVAKLDPAGFQRFFVGETSIPGETSLATLLGTQIEQIDVPPECDDCMISYTSGTTGRPKGVITTQANYIVANGFLNATYWRVSADDRILVTTPLAHRTAFARVGNMAVLGATLYIMPRFDAEEATRIIEAEQITLISIVPTVGRMMLPSIEASSDRYRSLRVLVATGEAFPVEAKRRLMAALPHLQIFSFFAMTEAGALAMLQPHDQLKYSSSVGRVTPGVELRLVNEAGEPVRTGEAGEIWVRSGLPGQYLLFRTYFRQPDAIRDAFQNGWFKTGDIGRFDEEGYLYIVDRKKDMVLSGGYNVYSKEVELVLLRHPGVADAAVIGVPDEIYGESVAAFVELDPGAAVSADALIQRCAEELASYKKPKHVVFVRELPKNSTGKVLKTELRSAFKKPQIV